MLIRKTRGFFTKNHSFRGEFLVFIRHAFGLLPSHKIIILTGEGAYLWNLLDADTPISLEELKIRLQRCTKTTISIKRLRSLIRTLRRHNLIATEKTSRALQRITAKFYSMPSRKDRYAGILYSAQPRILRKMLEDYFMSAEVRQFAGHPEKKAFLKGIVAPHSHYAFSGKCAAYAYNILRAHPMPDIVIILGPEHSGIATTPYTVLLKDFHTPLGTVKVDRDFGERVRANCSFDICADNIVHEGEHSIELQLPFLQYAYRERIKRLRILPVLCGRGTPAIKGEDFIEAIRVALRQTGKRPLYVATGDLVHAAMRPSLFNLKFSSKLFHLRNKEMIKLLASGKAGAFLKTVSLPQYRTVCGRYPLHTLLKLINPARGEALEYTWTHKNQGGSYKERMVDENIGHVSMAFYQ